MSVELTKIQKSYGNVEILPPLSLSIAKGELLALLGPSGCGKTTTLRIIAGLEMPDAGVVSIDGKDMTKVPPEDRGLGMVFQHYAIWPHRTVGRNVAYPLELRRTPKDEIEKRVKESLALVHLEGLSERRPDQLSGGQLQRVALARALVARPRVLLLDEPLSNLDAVLRDEMRAEIRALQRKLEITTVIVTHDQAEALSIADRVAVLRKGRVEQLGTPSEVYQTPATAFVAGFVGGGNAIPVECDGERLSLPGGGKVDAPADTKRGKYTLIVRPEDVRVADEGVDVAVKDRLFLGDRTELRLLLGDLPIRMTTATPPAGEKARVSFARITLAPPDA